MITSVQIITTITKKFVSITIKHVESIDCGVYTCKMQNTVSQVSVDFTLSMKGECCGLECSDLTSISTRQALAPTGTGPGHLED